MNSQPCLHCLSGTARLHTSPALRVWCRLRRWLHHLLSGEPA